MNNLAALGTSIATIVQPTWQLYSTLLQHNSSAIKRTLSTRKTFHFGPDPSRHNLDIYYPTTVPKTKNVLLFSYGGGLVRGDRTLAQVPGELAYANIAHFFCEAYGWTVVVADYRVVPQAKFPDGGEDVALAVQWLCGHLEELGGRAVDDGHNGEGWNLFMMGNSAGGVHQSTFLWGEGFEGARGKVLRKEQQGQQQDDVGDGEGGRLRLRAVVLLSVPLHFGKADMSRADVLRAYYGEDVEGRCPLGLLRAATKERGIAELLPGVRFLALTGSLDPDDEILLPNRDFADAWREIGGQQATLEVQVMEGHNHISPPGSLGTGIPEEEAWGKTVAEFCMAAAR
jgi:hypothetical protein